MKRLISAIVGSLFFIFVIGCNSSDDGISSSLPEGSDLSEIPTEASEKIAEESEDEASNFESVESSADPVEESSDVEESSKVEESSEPDENDIGDAVLLPTKYILFNGGCYYGTTFSATNAAKYASIYAEYAELFPNTRISVVNMPQSAFGITNPTVRGWLTDQGEILDKMEAEIYGDVNFVNLKNIFAEHRGEYLYYRSDYHWTHRAAYYAYYAFAESIGLTPTPLSAFEEKVITDSFKGKTNTYAKDDRVLEYVDTVYAYMPRKEHTMSIYYKDLTLYRTFSNCVVASRKGYACFINGDQPYTEINVPENDQEKTALVIKESSGNAFTTYLIEHYGNIIVIDPRHIDIDIRNLVTEKGVDDIIFCATASTSNGSGYYNYYCKLIGKQ